MSFITGTQYEVLYSANAGGTQLNTFTTEDNLMKALPECLIPAGFFFNISSTGKSLRIRASGKLGTTSAPTFTWSIRILTTTTWSAGGILLGATAALTAGTTQTLAPWFMDVGITMRTLGITAASTLITEGEVRSPLGLASPFAGTIPANNVGSTVTNFDRVSTYYLFLSAACGTSNAANLIQLDTLELHGCN